MHPTKVYFTYNFVKPQKKCLVANLPSLEIIFELNLQCSECKITLGHDNYVPYNRSFLNISITVAIYF
jgi:hypothetical protein